MRLWVLLIGLFIFTGSVAIDAIEFVSEAEERRYRALVEEVRCLVCQNQSLADSDADLAGDLRDEILALMRQGRSDMEIKDYLTERYGDFVLYRPPLKPSTWALWIGPWLILGVGLLVLWRSLRRRDTSEEAAP